MLIEESISSNEDSVENIVVSNLEFETLHKAIQSLTKEEFKIINMLFLSPKPMTENDLAELLGVSQQMINKRKKSIIKKRIAAYCRVSTDSMDQKNSFITQIKYYSNYVKTHPQYELVDIYADEGITGTSMKKRDEFKRMLNDCQKGKIDRIVTKSVSRFARNANELISAIRMLKEMDISVFFEEQGIDTDKINVEMLVTLPALSAQQESQNISDNVRWSYKKRMESGQYNTSCPAYGFRMINDELRIKEDEAEVVRRIFDLYLQGYGKQSIANILNKENPDSSRKWYVYGIDYILNNERYMGDAVLQKKYTTETLSSFNFSISIIA